MTVGFFSPLPPARTGVADYSAALLPALKALGPVALDDSSADLCLYHIGNNQLHRDIYRRALERPGVAVLHDAVLHHFFLGSLGERDYVAEFVYNYGPWNEDLARMLWRDRARSAADPRYFERPMLRRIARASLALIVHNPAAAAMAKAHAPGAVIAEIPHLFAPPALPPGYEAERLRASLGLNGQTYLFGVFGHLRESKRIAAILRAFGRVRRERPAALLVAGEFASRDLARSLDPLLNAPGVIRRGYLPEKDFWRHAAAIDAGINLRYPAAGESSGIAVRLMGIGKPVLLTAGAESSGFAGAASIPIDPGAGEEDMLAAAMLWLAHYPEDGRAIGERAAEGIRRSHSLPVIAGRYRNFLSACYHKESPFEGRV